MVLEAILDILQILLFPGIFFCLTLALFYSWIDRKYHADLQNRMGPTYTGWRGILQPFADFIKLMAKEDITPAAADRRGFAAVPIVMLAVPLTALLLIPISSATGIISFPGDIVFLMFLSTIIAILIFLAGWFSTNVFSDIGATRPVLHFTNGENALHYLTSKVNEKPCIILLDLNMPRMNGIEFLNVVKANEQLIQIPVIVLTTSREQRDIVNSFELSVAGYLVKPVDYEQFVNAISTIKRYWSLSKLPDQEMEDKNAEFRANSVSRR